MPSDLPKLHLFFLILGYFIVLTTKKYTYCILQEILIKSMCSRKQGSKRIENSLGGRNKGVGGCVGE